MCMHVCNYVCIMILTSTMIISVEVHLGFLYRSESPRSEVEEGEEILRSYFTYIYTLAFWWELENGRIRIVDPTHSFLSLSRIWHDLGPFVWAIGKYLWSIMNNPWECFKFQPWFFLNLIQFYYYYFLWFIQY